MKINVLEKIILISSSNLMREKGRKILQKGLLKNIQGKRIGEFYFIYGRVENENTYIKINTKSQTIEKVKCSCNVYKDLSSGKRNFMCGHIIATLYKFINVTKRNEKKAVNKDKVEVSIKNNEESQKDKRKICKVIRKEKQGKVFYEFRENLGEKKIIVKNEELRKYLSQYSLSKIKFAYETLEVYTPVIKNNLPIGFTLKEEEGKLVVTSYKKMPLNLTDKNDVFFFNNELYLPTKKQIEAYKSIESDLREKGKIVLDLTMDNYTNIFLKLENITNKIIIRDEIEAFVNRSVKVELYFYGGIDSVFCKVYAGYDNNKIDILKNKKNPFISKEKREEIITRICNFGFLEKGECLRFIGSYEELYEILKVRNEELRKLGNIVLDKKFKNKIFINADSLNLDLENAEEGYKIIYDIKGMSYNELFSAYEYYEKGYEFYKSSSGFIDFKDEGVRSFFNLFGMAKGKRDKEIILDENKGIILNEIIKKIPHVKGLETIEDIKKIINEEAIVPKKFKGTLRSYQKEGYRWLKSLSKLMLGGILADEMGLGKTIQIIALMLSEKGKKFLIVCPASLIFNWKNEIEKFAPDITIGITHGNKRKDVLKDISIYDCILTTYSTLKIDKELYKDLYFDFLVIDEAQNIKNPKTEITKAVKSINSKINFALTGTPIENNLLELWSIFDFIMKGYLFSENEFKEKFMRRNSNIEELKVLVSPFILRRKKSNVLKELPDKEEKQVIVDMTREQKIIYKSFMEEARERIKTSEEGNELFAYLTKLRQICLDPKLVYKDYLGESGKIRTALRIINESKGKILLFSQFTSLLNNISCILEERGITYTKIDGKVSPKERIYRVNKFNEDKEIKVFLISLKAGGYGLNLTSAKKIILFDPWWNPAVEDQAADRAHRIGQKKVVEVIRLVAKDTIEEKIINLKEDKKKLIDNVLTGELKENNLSNKLTKDEIIKLIF